MTEKELHKLRRQDLLQLLIEQGKKTAQLEQTLEETQTELEALQANYEKLRKRLDMKDEKIHGLREKMAEMAETRKIQLEEAGSIAEAAMRLNGVFEAAQKAADQYLYNVQNMGEKDK